MLGVLGGGARQGAPGLRVVVSPACTCTHTDPAQMHWPGASPVLCACTTSICVLCVLCAQVVDVGGGTGFCTLGVVKSVPGKNVTLIDQSPHQLAKAKAKPALKDVTILEVRSH